jgi:hypothetical protein
MVRYRRLRTFAVQPAWRTAVFTLLAQRWSLDQSARGLPGHAFRQLLR